MRLLTETPLLTDCGLLAARGTAESREMLDHSPLSSPLGFL